MVKVDINENEHRNKLCTSIKLSLEKCLQCIADIERSSVIPGNCGITSMHFLSALMASLQHEHQEAYLAVKQATFDPELLQCWEVKCHALTTELNSMSDTLQNTIAAASGVAAQYQNQFDDSVWTAVGSISLSNTDLTTCSNNQQSFSPSREARNATDELEALYGVVVHRDYNFIARLLSNMLYFRVSTRSAVCRFIYLLSLISIPNEKTTILSDPQSHQKSFPDVSHGPPGFSGPSQVSYPLITYIINEPTLCSILVDNLRDARLSLSSCAIIDALIRAASSCNSSSSSEELARHLFMEFDVPIIILNLLSSPAFEARNAALGALRRCLLHARSAGPEFIIHRYSIFFNTLDKKLIKARDITIKRPVIKLLFDVLSERLYLR